MLFMTAPNEVDTRSVFSFGKPHKVQWPQLPQMAVISRVYVHTLFPENGIEIKSAPSLDTLQDNEH